MAAVVEEGSEIASELVGRGGTMAAAETAARSEASILGSNVYRAGTTAAVESTAEATASKVADTAVVERGVQPTVNNEISTVGDWKTMTAKGLTRYTIPKALTLLGGGIGTGVLVTKLSHGVEQGYEDAKKAIGKGVDTFENGFHQMEHELSLAHDHMHLPSVSGFAIGGVTSVLVLGVMAFVGYEGYKFLRK